MFKKFKNRIVLTLPLLFTPMNAHADVSYDDLQSAVNRSNDAYVDMLSNDRFIGGVGDLFAFVMTVLQSVYSVTLALTCFTLVFTIIRYGMSQDKANKRADAKTNIMICLILLAILGALPVIYVLLVQLLGAL